VDHRRLWFTMDRRHSRPRELTGAWPPATPGLKVTREGAGEVEEAAAVSTFVGSSELGRWGNDSTVERDDRLRSVLSGGVFRCGRGGERDGEWCGMLRGGGSPFIGARGGCRGGDNGRHQRRNRRRCKWQF
jgi:hypothetical protein